MAGQYTRNTWVNGAPPAINDTNLNNVETGIESASRYSRSVSVSTTDDSDLTLTTAQNQYGRIEIDTTASTTGINVIMDGNEHTFLAVVTGGQSVTFKNATGTGTAVASGEAKELRNNTTDVIEFEGGSGREVATATEIRTGTDNNKVVTPLGINDTIFGMGQTLQDVGGSRAFNTTYTNTSGRPIEVFIAWRITTNENVTLQIDGVTVFRQFTTANQTDKTVFVVPDGSTYRMNVGGSSTLEHWKEIR